MAGFSEAYSKLERQRDELLAALQSLWKWQGCCQELPSDELGEQVRAAIANATRPEQPLTRDEMISEVSSRR